jgi:hypothetical protein
MTVAFDNNCQMIGDPEGEARKKGRLHNSALIGFAQ